MTFFVFNLLQYSFRWAISKRVFLIKTSAKGRRKKNISCGPVRKVMSPTPYVAVFQFYFFCNFFHFSICISKDPDSLMNIFRCPNTYISKMFQQNTLFPFHIILHFFLIIKKKYFGCGQRVPPPPLPFTDRSATNIFFTPSLRHP